MTMSKTLLNAAAMCAAMTVGSAHAQIQGVTSTGLSNDATRTWETGYRFTVNSAISVVDLGAYDAGRNGLSSSHTVSLWQFDAATNSGSLLRSVVINAGTSATLDGDFRYSSVSPLSLTVGNSYLVAASNYGAADPYGQNGTRVTAPQITFNEARIVPSSASVFPTATGSNDGFYGGNFRFLASAAPEPSAWALMILGFGIVGYALRTRKRSISFGNQVARTI